jgi:hypothetical protein
MPQDTIALAPLPKSTTDNSPGSAELAADLMKSFAPPTAPAPEAPKEPTPPAEPAKKPDVTPPAAPKKDDKPAAAAPAIAKTLDPDDPKISAPELRKELKRMRETGEISKREFEKQMGELREKISGYEKRRYYTDDDLKQSEATTKRLSELESELYSRDYATSPEYKSKFQDRLDQIWGEAQEEVKGMTVKYQDGVDAEQQPIMKERAATTNDLLQVIDAPASQRLAIAKRLFGDDREPVLQWARDIASLRKDASRAIEEKRTGYASEVTKRDQQFRDANQRISAFISDTSKQLEQQYPEIFSAPADKPEIAEALKKGFSFVDESSSKMMEFNLNERAARAALVRSWAGAFPRLVLDLSQKSARIAELEGQIKKLQGSDPGELGGGGGGGGKAEGARDGGSDDLAAELDALNKR